MLSLYLYINIQCELKIILKGVVILFKRFFTSLLATVMLFSFVGSAFAEDAEVDSINNQEEFIGSFDINQHITFEDMYNFDNAQFEKDFPFLANDPVFLELEATLANGQFETEMTDGPVIQQRALPAIVIGALRILTSKVGRQAADKAWAIARPHIQKALSAPSKFIIDGPDGGKIIQVRSKATKKPIFRLDYHYIDGKGPYLHYHVPPNMKAHHFIW